MKVIIIGGVAGGHPLRRESVVWTSRQKLYLSAAAMAPMPTAVFRIISVVS